MDIKESDWKIFRKLRVLALERYCARVLEEVRLTIDNDDKSTHERYLELWELLRSRDRSIAIAFNDPKRRNAILS